jgi:hypothetical protein
MRTLEPPLCGDANSDGRQVQYHQSWDTAILRRTWLRGQGRERQHAERDTARQRLRQRSKMNRCSLQ